MVKTMLQLLSERRQAVNKLVEILKRLYLSAQVYLFGGAAENRFTVLSDIDILVVFPEESIEPEKRVQVLAEIWEELEKIGLAHYPFDIHVVGYGDLERYRRRSRLIRLA